ncbi:formate dehydrogenase subunit gamma [Caenimonas koreensis]|uniref:formate dehydrogenase subunit gamma n=1 Tax=Caenimonas koreensis TaxID=367474 RepID=UPI003784D13A
MERLIQRYPDRTRMNHWLVAMLFVCAALSGFAFFHPALYFFTALFGGGAWTRILHPFIGVVMMLCFAGMFVQVWRDNVWRDGDGEWVRRSGTLLRGDEDGMPAVGKYNGGQKAIFWLFTLCLVVLLVTGFTFWQPWFADAFPITVRRIGVLLHAVAAFILVLGAIVHIYAAIWVKGSIRAMTRGYVTTAWARRHHLLWYREVAGDK